MTRLIHAQHISLPGLPDALQSAAHAIITSKDYLSGVQANVKVGGDNCSRSGFIGACLAAQVFVTSFSLFISLK